MALAEVLGNIRKLPSKLSGALDPVDDASTTRSLDELLVKAKEARRPYEGQWLLNMAFYFGKQWTIWSAATSTLDKPAVEPWRVMPNVNYVRPAILTTYAKIVKARQAARTQPAGSDVEDESAARACDKLLDYLWPVSKSEDALKKATVWMLITGTGLLKPCWDKTWGDVIGQDPQTGDDLHLGEVQTYSISPFDFYGEPGCLEIDEMEWAFHVTIRPASYVKKMYGKDIEDSDYDNTMTFESQLKAIITGDASKTKGVILKEFYRRPTADYPNGQFIVYVNDEIVENKDNPYKDDLPIPFIPIRGNPRPDSFWGISFVDDMIDPQRILNKTFGEALEVQRQMSKPKWLVPIGSMTESEEITNAPDEVRYVPVQGKGPEPVKGSDIPTGYFKVISEAKSDLFEASGQHEVSHGQSPYTRTAAGIAYLQEQDDSRLSPMIRNYDEAYELLEAAKLDFARVYYDEARTLTILGKDNKTEVVTFYKDKIPNDVHVHIVAGGQALPRSRVARQDLLLKLWTVQPPILDDPQAMLKLLEFGEVEGVWNSFQADISQATDENQQMLGGTPVQAREFNNHLIHIKEHNKARNTSAYSDLPPDQQSAMDSHVAAHQQVYANQVMNVQKNFDAHNAMKAASLGKTPPDNGEGMRAPGQGLGPLAEPASPAGQHTAGQPGGGAT